MESGGEEYDPKKVRRHLQVLILASEKQRLQKVIPKKSHMGVISI